MQKYIIVETKNLDNVRPNETIQAKSLTSAKKAATRSQVWADSVLSIKTEGGNFLSHKGQNGWIDAEWLSH